MYFINNLICIEFKTTKLLNLIKKIYIKINISYFIHYLII